MFERRRQMTASQIECAVEQYSFRSSFATRIKGVMHNKSEVVVPALVVLTDRALLPIYRRTL